MGFGECSTGVLGAICEPEVQKNLVVVRGSVTCCPPQN